MALSHAVSYQNMSLHPPTRGPFLILKSAPCYSSFLGHGRFRAMARAHQPTTTNQTHRLSAPKNQRAPGSHAGLHYGEIL
jgi:hypothetical protein